MRSIADDLRRDTAQRIRAMSVPERIQLALALGDADLDRFMRASGLERSEALRRLTAQRAAGRPKSCASDER